MDIYHLKTGSHCCSDQWLFSCCCRVRQGHSGSSSFTRTPWRFFTLKPHKNKHKKANCREKGWHRAELTLTECKHTSCFWLSLTVWFQKSRFLFKETVKPVLSGLAGSRRSRWTLWRGPVVGAGNACQRADWPKAADWGCWLGFPDELQPGVHL